jgi:tetratricopeptide (TPR) repeat protein
VVPFASNTGRKVAGEPFLQRDLWPGIIPKESASYVNNAVSVVRVILKPEGAETSLLLDVEDHSRYGLAGQELLWVDVEAALHLLQEAEAAEQADRDPLPFLDEAAGLLSRGIFLEGEEHLWLKARRETVARAWRGCRLWQAQLYQQREQWSQAQTLLDSLLEENPNDEDALCSLMQLLQVRGRPSEALHLYHELVERLTQQSKQPLEATRQVAEQMHSAPAPTTLYLPPHASSSFVLMPKDRPSLPAVPQGIIEKNLSIPGMLVLSSSFMELDTLDIMQSRRQVLQGLLNVACATLTLSPYTLLDTEQGERLEKALLNPSRADMEMVGDLFTITRRYWRLCANSSIDLLSGISGHFTTVIQLLKEAHPTPIYRQLCSLAGENAQILGKTLHDLREYHLAWTYYAFSINAAKEAGNAALQVCGLGRMALLLIYWGRPQHALPLVQEAQQYAGEQIRLQSWLAAIKAEIYAYLDNADASARALDVSKEITARSPLEEEDRYFTGFTLSRQAGYEGACLVRLHQPERALPALQKAFDLIDPTTAVRRRSTLLADMSAVQAQLGDVKGACSLACQSLDLTLQTKSLSVLQRISTVRKLLMPWKDDTEVQHLDMQITSTIASVTNRKGVL